jgi:hypothetical protein
MHGIRTVNDMNNSTFSKQIVPGLANVAGLSGHQIFRCK